MPSRTALAAVASAFVCAAGLSPEDFRISRLPGEAVLPLSPSPRGFEQYSGYMPLGDAGGTELFFWFVESQRNPAEDPVVFWTNGGPGASSVAFGFWTEHGPYRPGANAISPEYYEHSWNRIASVIYLEMPTGVGFSFSRDESLYANITDELAAEQSHAFLAEFFKVFSGFVQNPFFVTGESYGGHYVPNLAEKLLDDPLDINMKGFLIGNPGINSDWYYNVDEFAFVTFMWSHGLIPVPEYMAAHRACGWEDFYDRCEEDFTHPSPACLNATQAAVDLIPDELDLYNILSPTCHNDKRERTRAHGLPFLKHLKERYGRELPFDPCLADTAAAYMDRDDVLAAIHARRDPSRTWPDTPSGWSYDGGVAGEQKNIAKLFPRFFEEAPGWRIWVVSGDTDAAVPLLGTERWMECLGRDLVSSWEPWMLNGEVAGMVRTWDRMSLVTVKGCGHMVPWYCNEAGFQFFANYLAGAGEASKERAVV